MDKLLSNKKHIAIFALPSLIIFFTLVIIPLIISGYYSLFEYDGISKMKFIGLDNYINMLTNDKNLQKQH
jgi:raffinose/stachyose/melibiose transport system permease protein